MQYDVVIFEILEKTMNLRCPMLVPGLITVSPSCAAFAIVASISWAVPSVFRLSFSDRVSSVLPIYSVLVRALCCYHEHRLFFAFIMRRLWL